MSACADCGAPSSDSGPFCPVCGADGRRPLEWIGSSTPSTSSTTVVRSGAGRPSALMVGVGVSVVLLFGWAALGGSDESPAESAASSTTAPSGTTEPVESTTTTAPQQSETTEWLVVDPSSPTTEFRSDQTVDGEQKPTGPMLGYETGLVAIGNDLSGRSVVDLDTGLRMEIEIPGRAVGVVDGHLLTAEDGGATWAIPLADLDAAPVLLSESTLGLSQVGRSRTPGAVWVSAEGPEATWRLVDVASGSTLDRIDPAPSFGLRWGIDGVGPELVSPVSGGVFEWGPEGYLRIRDGFLTTVSGETALVLECDDSLRCAWQRYSVADWSAVGDPIVAERGASGYAQLLARGRLLWLSDSTGGSVTDLQTGNEPQGIRESDIFEGFHSDDSGRFMTFRVGSEVRLLDLDTGAFADLDLFGDAVLVPRSEVQSLFDSGS